MPEEVMALLISHWIAFLAGLFGLAVRVSRVPLPNGGQEPSTTAIHIWRLFRVWSEATAFAFIFGIAAVIVATTKQDVVMVETAHLFIALAVFIGAACSDVWASWVNIMKALKDITAIADALLNLITKGKGK